MNEVTWIVRLRFPGSAQGFDYEVDADTEVAALAMALVEYPRAYVDYTRRKAA